MSIAEARALAEGPPRYVAIRGRIDAEDEFEDEAHRPLVLRRAAPAAGAAVAGGRSTSSARPWTSRSARASTASPSTTRALDDGLVVVPRESVGTAADVPDRVPAGTPRTTPVRLRIEQVSSVEHAIVVGVPASTRPTAPSAMTAGLGRPLVLTTLERDEAMRVLRGGIAPRRPFCAVIAMVASARSASRVAESLWAILGAVDRFRSGGLAGRRVPSSAATRAAAARVPASSATR